MDMTLKKYVVVVNSADWVRFVLLSVYLNCLTAEDGGGPIDYPETSVTTNPRRVTP